MKVGVDTFHRHTVSARRGIGRYAEGLLAALRQYCPGDEYVAFAPECDPFNARAWTKHLRRFLSAERPDIFLIPSPFEYDRPLPTREALGECQLAAVIHDFIPLRFSREYLNAKRLPWYQETVDFLRGCDLLLANSETTKSDATDLAGLDGGRIQVIYGGVDPNFRPGEADGRILAGYGITGLYVLYVGAFDFRKNVEGLVRAFGAALGSLGVRPQLVLPSADASERAVGKLRAIAGSDGWADSLLLPGHVPDEALIHLYRGATLFAMPSLWEGLGLPVLEAMACGAPVLTSANSSLAEVASDAALLVDPLDYGAMADAIVTGVSDPVRRTELRERGVRRAQLFTWAATAGRASDALQVCVRRPPGE